MKLKNIPTFQQGGPYIPPFAVFQVAPTASERTQTASSSGSDSSKKDLTDKDVLDMLKSLNGLPSDITAITRELQSFYVDGSRRRRLGNTYTANASLAVRYLGALNKMKIAEFNKKEYENAYTAIKEKGGFDEVAIDDRGRLICVNDKGDFKKLSPEELLQSDGSYTPLTNNELLQHRAEDLSMANQNGVLAVVRNGTSMAAITKQIQEVIAKIGTDTVSQEGYLSTKQGRIIQGLQDFEKAVQEASGNQKYDGTVNDLYKYKYLSKDQATKASEAMSYIYATLSKTAKSLLKYKSDMTDEGAKKLLQTLVASTLDSTQEFGIDLEGGKSAKSTTKGQAAGKDTTDLKGSQLVNMVKAIDGVKTPMIIDRGDGVQMTVYGRQFNLITDMSGKPIEDTSLSGMLSQSGIQGIVKNMSNITFGDQKVSPEALKNITYNNTGVMRVNLPINPDGSVNLGLLDAYQKMEARLDTLGRQPTAEEVERAYQEAGLTSLLKANGQPDETKFGAFLVTEGYTTDALSGIKPSDFVKEYRGDTDMAVQILQNSLKVGSGKDAVTPDIDTFSWINPADWFGNYDTIYKAAIYIPIDNGIVGAARLDGQKLDYDEVMSLEQKYQNFDKQSRFRTTSGDALLNTD